MTREIKFRSWIGEKMDYSPVYVNPPNLDINSVFAGSTLQWMQFTGLKDKNGKEIYEGDLLKKEDSEKPRVVKWTDQNGAYFVLSNSATEKVNWDDCLTDERINTFGYEIIGNIYENPELIK